MTITLDLSYEEGWDAKRDGQGPEANPYPEGSQQHRLWDIGNRDFDPVFDALIARGFTR